MKNEFPHNRLQEIKLKKTIRPFLLIFTLGVALIFSLILFPTKTFAAASSWDPSDFFNGQPPSISEARGFLLQADVSQCGLSPGGKCLYFSVFNRVTFAGYSGAGQTCIMGADVPLSGFVQPTEPAPGAIGVGGVICSGDGVTWASVGATTSYIKAVPNALITPYDVYIDGFPPPASAYEISAGLQSQGYLYKTNYLGPTRLITLSSSPYIVGNPISFNISWEFSDFDVFWEELYKNPNNPQFHTNLGQNFNVGSSNGFNFTATYSGTGSYTPTVVLGNSLCTGASSTGAVLVGQGCEYVVVPVSVPIYVNTSLYYLNSTSGSSLNFQWEGPTSVYNYYGSGGSVLAPTGSTNNNNTSIFNWVAGSGSLYYQQSETTETGGLVNFLGPQGIFNGSMFGFSGFGTTGNPFLDFGQALLMIVMFALFWVSQFLFNLLSLTAVFSFVVNLLHPVAGVCHTLPDTVFSFANPFLAGEEFCVAYVANTGNYVNVYRMVQFFSMLSIFGFVLNHFIHSTNKAHGNS